ncbi:hypothetical protein Pan110_16890 [Gimesia panareensis]|nr:hypothetical protein Pan110_16890 [Gimesia panareensis]
MRHTQLRQITLPPFCHNQTCPELSFQKFILPAAENVELLQFRRESRTL